MKPIDGVIINEEQIQIRGGTILNVEKHKLKVGQRVKICWDFTENCVQDIVPDTDTHPIHEMGTSPCRDEEDEYIEYDDTIDSCIGLP